MNNELINPFILKETFSPLIRQRLLDDCDLLVNIGDTEYDNVFNRMVSNFSRLYCYSEILLPIVREFFKDDSILPSYNCWAKYNSPNSKLWKHKDANACTFTIDYCVRQREPWPLFVEGSEYVLQENDSLIYMGEDQEHWREDFSDGNEVEMIFFHFVRPDHWYFTKK